MHNWDKVTGHVSSYCKVTEHVSSYCTFHDNQLANELVVTGMSLIRHLQVGQVHIVN